MKTNNKKCAKLEKLNRKIIACRKCSRLAAYIRKISQDKVLRFRDQHYWGKPLTGFGDFHARLLVIGLAPAAHGGNRTGRMFTGDSSGDWLAKVLYENGFASQPTSLEADDGLRLIDAYITASVRCAPPQNKPLRKEFENCFPYIVDEFSLLKQVRIIVCLGRIAFNTCCKLLSIKDVDFAHGKLFTHQNLTVICSYHPSRQNTQTGRLKWKDWSSVFAKARKILDDKQGLQKNQTGE
ncbi:MAG: uracil-DNA glycosylase [Thaumarchaeota archaeon]|nr:uracil-DNA glycosylase [Nitrososphaerota archaeon]